MAAIVIPLTRGKLWRRTRGCGTRERSIVLAPQERGEDMRVARWFVVVAALVGFWGFRPRRLSLRTCG